MQLPQGHIRQGQKAGRIARGRAGIDAAEPNDGFWNEPSQRRRLPVSQPLPQRRTVSSRKLDRMDRSGVRRLALNQRGSSWRDPQAPDGALAPPLLRDAHCWSWAWIYGRFQVLLGHSRPETYGRYAPSHGSESGPGKGADRGLLVAFQLRWRKADDTCLADLVDRYRNELEATPRP